MYKLFIYFFSTIVVSQRVLPKNNLEYRQKLYFEVCSTNEISMCGNYFEQNLMRDSFLIKINEENFLKSYDTVFCVDYKSLKDINNHINILDKKDTLSVIYPKKFLNKLNKFLKKEKLKEKSNNTFNYIPLEITFKVEKIETGKVTVINPNFYYVKKDNLFLVKDIIIVFINDLKIEYNDCQRKRFYIDKKGFVFDNH